MATDVADLRSELERVKEEKDKYEKQLEKSRYLIPQNNQVCMMHITHRMRSLHVHM